MKQLNEIIAQTRSKIARLVTIALLVAVLAQQVAATTYISAEPIPNQDVVGQSALDLIESVGYSNLELWGNRLLNQCNIVQSVIDVLTSNDAISTINSSNTRFRVAAGGFEGVTNPSFVFTVEDSGPNAASAADVAVLSNALGYVLSQGGTAHFSPDNSKAYDFPLDYAVVTFTGILTGLEAKEFFDFLGTINPALWSGTFAGFTQIDLQGSNTNNSMLFLRPAVTKQTFITGLSTAAEATSGATYSPLGNNGQPTTAKAGISFPENDWAAFPGGDTYLANLNNPSTQLLNQVEALRQRHLQAVANFVDAIERDKVDIYLNHQFRCPTEVTVTNTGKRAGADVAQVYLTDAARQKRMRLLGFERVDLAAGASKSVRFDDKAGQWRIAGGTCKVIVARSANAPVLTAEGRMQARLFGQ